MIKRAKVLSIMTNRGHQNVCPRPPCWHGPPFGPIGPATNATMGSVPLKPWERKQGHEKNETFWLQPASATFEWVRMKDNESVEKNVKKRVQKKSSNESVKSSRIPQHFHQNNLVFWESIVAVRDHYPCRCGGLLLSVPFTSFTHHIGPPWEILTMLRCTALHSTAAKSL